MPTLLGLGPAVEENSEECAFFERGKDDDALASAGRGIEPPLPVSGKVSARRRARLRRVVAGVVGVASILAALAAAKAMVPPRRGSLDAMPEPTEPIVVAMGALDSKPVSVPSIGRELRAPSKRHHHVRVGEAPRHRARGHSRKSK